MRRLKITLIASVLALGVIGFSAGPAHAENCDEPGGCCRDVTVAGKITLFQICPV